MIAKRKGVIVRWGLKEAWSKRTSRCTRNGSLSVKSTGSRSGGCVRKAAELTSGDLPFVPDSGLRAFEFDLIKAAANFSAAASNVHHHVTDSRGKAGLVRPYAGAPVITAGNFDLMRKPYSLSAQLSQHQSQHCFRPLPWYGLHPAVAVQLLGAVLKAPEPTAAK